MNPAVILSACRSAVAPRAGAFAALKLHNLAAPVLRDAVARAGVGVQDVDEVIVGNALGAGGNPARMIALAAGLPERVAGLSIDRQCCSGMDAVLLAAHLVTSGAARVVVAGGAESHSQRPLRATVAEDGTPQFYDRPAFAPDPSQDPDLAQAADALGISREDQDAWAVESHAKALNARDVLRAEITPLEGLDQDTFTRELTRRVASRAPRLAGDVTTANTAVAADAAAFVVVVSADIARSQGLPFAQIMAGTTLGAAPALPGLAPVAAIEKVLVQAQMPDLAVVSMMEAYAAQAVACMRATQLNPERVNPCGGALARGHPIGASGAVEVVRLWHDLTRSGGTGLAAIAAAGGLGSALILRA